MKKILLLTFVFFALLTGTYRHAANVYMDNVVQDFINAQKTNGIFISVEKERSTNHLFTLGRAFENVHIKTPYIDYQNAALSLSVSLWTPWKARLTAQGDHHVNGMKITSSPVTVMIDFRIKTLTGTVIDILTPIERIDLATVHLSWHNADVSLNPLWLQTKNVSFTLTGTISPNQASLTADVIGWKNGLAQMKEKRLLSKDMYKSLRWTLGLLSTGDTLSIPIFIQGNQIRVAGITFQL